MTLPAKSRMAGLPSLFARRPRWLQGAAAATTRALDSTFESERWESMRRAGRRWGWLGAGLGAVAGLVMCAPASWLANAVTSVTSQRLLLAEADGTVWQGSAVAVLSGGPGSRDARVLPGRLHWQLGWRERGVSLVLQQDCCTPEPVAIHIKPSWGRVDVTVGTRPDPRSAVQASGELGHWPAAWLGGLGTPWNTLQLSGALRVSSNQLSVAWAKGQLQVSGQVEIWLDHVASRVTTLNEIGSYRLLLQGRPQGPVQMSMRTLEGALQLSGEGQIGPRGVQFRGEARASEAERGALDNLLNIIGRREGDRSVISIG